MINNGVDLICRIDSVNKGNCDDAGRIIDDTFFT